MSGLASPARSAIPAARVRALSDCPVRIDRDIVVYWMTAFRRTRYNFALQRAVEWAQQLHKPLLVFEALRLDYPWASDRFHRFVIDGMADNHAACSAAGVTYYPYVEPTAGAGKGLLAALANLTCVIVTDDYPAFFLPAARRAAAARADVLMEAVDSNGLHALAGPGRAFDSALAFRRWFQGNAFENLLATPLAEPLAAAPSLPATIPDDVLSRWPAVTLGQMAPALSALPIDHTVAPVPARGGSSAAVKGLERFVGDSLEHYGARRGDPSADTSSGLSPYLHFGHISAHEIFAAIARYEEWSPDRIGSERRGKRTGFWGMSASAEAFLDQLAVWRELGFNFCSYRPDYDRFESLPAWARQTLERHERDPRPHIYTIEQLERAETSDEVWNAAQTQLARKGVIHNYMRMLWGKRIIEWTSSPRDALDALVHLNNKYALDGRDPNSYSGIFWTLGRYDRPWPERPIFGTVRYMSSANTLRAIKD
jgi:deoxyribodipyrimidine photo-lyase